MSKKEESKKIIDLVRISIKHYLDHNEYFQPNKNDYIEEIFSTKTGVFVTLKSNGKLRGCIGYIESNNTVLNNLIECSVSAAFNDPRFNPITNNEISKLDVTVSILSSPEEYIYTNIKDLLEYLLLKKPGVLLEHGFYKATYLPDVWEELNNPEEFLSSLCLKAGLNKYFWKNNNVKIYLYYSKIYSSK